MNRSLSEPDSPSALFPNAALGASAPMYATRRVLWSWGFGWSRHTTPEPEEPRRGRTRRKGGTPQKRK
jgi:hypothetical protein